MKALLIFFGCILLFAGGVFYWAVQHDYLLLSNTNSIVVTADTPLTADKVIIEFGISINSINRSSDDELFKRMGKYSLLFAGKELQQIENEYGENDFLITYDNTYYLAFRQFKTNWRHQHEYRFHFHKKGDELFLRCNITGVDDMSFDCPMRAIHSISCQ
ncbi:MAG: hypothetical protein JST26_08175 [Bacteroidetes bacterium]|nr:hypothetical protein [Bacteroidota bacterium]